MSVNQRVLKFLQESDNPAADDALVEGLAKGPPDCHEPILHALLARRQEAGLVGIVANFHLLDDKLRAMILEDAASFFPFIKKCVKAPEERTRLNAVDFVGKSGSNRLAYVLDLALHDSRPGIRQRAGETFRFLADRYFRQERVTLDALAHGEMHTSDKAAVEAYSLARLAEERSYLLSAFDGALTTYDIHQRPEVVEAATWFAPMINDRLWRAVSNTRSRCGHAVLTCVQSAKDPRIVPFLYEALNYRDLRAAVAHIMATRCDEHFVTELIRCSFLLADPRIRKGMLTIRNLAWLERGMRGLLNLPSSLFPRLVDFIMATGIPVEIKVGVFRELLLHGSPLAQRAAIWGLVDTEDENSTQMLRIVVQWDDAELAQVAIRELMRRHPEDVPAMMAEQVENSSRSISDMAGRELSEYGFERYWGGFDAMDDDDRFRVGRGLLSTDPQVIPQLRKRLTSSEPKDRLRVLQIINLLEIAPELKMEIYRIAHDSDTHVRSAVMTALGQLPGATSERLLLEALNDTDDRVQANGIEALERLRAINRLDQIRDRLNSDDNRVKANAVKALLSFQMREAMPILLEMLDNHAAAHRLSALWVIEVMKLMGLSAKVIRIARNDPDLKVRRRAVQAVSVLQHAIRGGAESPPATQVRQEVAG